LAYDFFQVSRELNYLSPTLNWFIQKSGNPEISVVKLIDEGEL
jgi:hypothetical protein